MDEEKIEKYIKAGKILRNILSRTAKNIQPGTKIIDICESSEKMIKDFNCKPAFPTNLSIGSIAAHYTSPINDKSLIPEKGLVKLDAGLHIDGYIVDSALTVSLNGDYEHFVEVAKGALEAAEKFVQPGVKVSRIGEEITSYVEKHGLRVIVNLSGHKIERYKLHAGVSIPNYNDGSSYRLKPGDVIAIEPFVTAGESKGLVSESKEAYIFSYLRNIPLIRGTEKRILEDSREKFKGLPFCGRWFNMSEKKFKKAVNRLITLRALNDYPVLVEPKGYQVAQFENTYLITKAGHVNLTGS